MSRRTIWVRSLVVLVLAAPLLVVAASITIVPFSNGEVADADDVNANFAALKDAVEAAASVAHTESLAPGACFTLTHGWNTRAVDYSAWMSTPSGGPWVPLAPSHEPLTTNLALSRPVVATTNYSAAHNAAAAVDGQYGNASCAGTWYATEGNGGHVTIDLGSVQSVGVVRVMPATHSPAACHWGTTSWDILLSIDGSTFSAAAASGACSWPGNCNTWFEHGLAPGSVARYVRFVAKTFTSGTASTSMGASLGELEVYASNYALTQPDADSVRLCNHTGLAREFSLTLRR